MAEGIKRKPGGDEPKVGVYICHCGGNISDHVDVEKVQAYAVKLPGVAVARRNTFMCSDPGQELIMNDIRSGKINRVVVASCAPSLHETTFRGAIARAGLNPYLYEHANIREQVSWVHHGEGADHKAAGLIAAAAAKAKRLQPLEPIRVDAVGRAVVIGGGVAGLKAARDLSRRGVKVALIEKSPFLGGNAAQLDKVFPTEEEAADLIAGLASDVLDDPDIEIFTCSEATESGGYVGNFTLKISRRPPDSHEVLEKVAMAKKIGAEPGAFIPFVGIQPFPLPTAPEELELKTGAIVLATGFRHYAPYKGEYGYGENPEVVTLPDLIKIMAADPSDGGRLRLNGRDVNSVAMIHCVGSRQIPGLHERPDGGELNEYCSRVCCTATLQAALEMKRRYPKTAVYDLYRDIRTYGRGHEDYYLNASKSGVVFIRFNPEDPPVVQKASDGESRLKITVNDSLLGGEELDVPVDLAVLAVGMEAGDVSSLVDMMKLPVGADRFLLEVHPKLRPVEVSAAGILLAGTAQAPMDITEATSAAAAASVKASAILSKGHVALDPFVARVDPLKCTGSGACLDACIREGAISMKRAEGESGRIEQAEVNPALCLGCGVCAAACPEGAIQVNGWSLDQYEAMVDAIVAHGSA